MYQRHQKVSESTRKKVEKGTYTDIGVDKGRRGHVRCVFADATVLLMEKIRSNRINRHTAREIQYINWHPLARLAPQAGNKLVHNSTQHMLRVPDRGSREQRHDRLGPAGSLDERLRRKMVV